MHVTDDIHVSPKETHIQFYFTCSVNFRHTKHVHHLISINIPKK